MNYRRIINYQLGAKESNGSIRCFLRFILKVFKDEISFNFGGIDFKSFGL